MTHQVRRATVDDLPHLRRLWQEGGLPAMDLEKRFTEFQLVSENNVILGAFGILMQKQQGFIHHEAFADAGPGPALWPFFWERIEIIAKNNGLLRLWTASQAPVFREKGFTPPDPDATQRWLPAFGQMPAATVTLKLRDELPAVSFDHEFKLFAQSSKEETERMMKQAQALKVFAYLLLTFFSIGAVALAVIAFIKRPRRR